MRLCWADKIPLGIFLAAILALFTLGNLDNPTAMNERWWVAFFDIEGLIFLKAVLPIWLVLRAIDFMFGGPSIRLARRRAAMPARW
jgi:hypothetical protein